ncbi:hypothetical protein HYT56_00795 [Candidatus Woesearchaeota archaeon]|nr:hypothetical protein [Candidatus Woesearchaeota archaeon]
MKKGSFALSRTMSLILVIVGLIILLFFAYFLRDKIVEIIDIALEFFKP